MKGSIDSILEGLEISLAVRTYARLEDDERGRRELAGKSVAVPFVGAIAGTLVTAEILRLLHGGQRYTDIKLTLGDLQRRSVRPTGPYGARDFVGLKYCDARIST